MCFLFHLQPKQIVAEIIPRPEPNWRCWRCLDRWRLGVRQSFAFWMNFHASRHFFGATRFFRIDKGHYQRAFVRFAAKTRRCRSCSSTKTRLVMLALPQLAMHSRTYNRATQNFLFLSLYILYAILARHPIFSDDNGHYQVNMLCLFPQRQFHFANVDPWWWIRRGKSDRR